MANGNLLTNAGEEPNENELPAPPPEANKGLYNGESSRVAMRVIVDDSESLARDEFPDPPPEENKG